jgi:hypothetical protein
MRTIIAGSRTARWADVLAGIQACPWSSEISSVLSGCAFGADLCGEDWARLRGVPIERHPANWKKHGRGAGPVRNAEMVSKADALIAIWDGESRGTADVIEKASAAWLKVFVWRFGRKTANHPYPEVPHV